MSRKSGPGPSKPGPSKLRMSVSAHRKYKKSNSSSASASSSPTYKIPKNKNEEEYRLNPNKIFDLQINPIGFTMLKDGHGGIQYFYDIQQKREYKKDERISQERAIPDIELQNKRIKNKFIKSLNKKMEGEENKIALVKGGTRRKSRRGRGRKSRKVNK